MKRNDQEPILITLCAACAAQFYNADVCRIRRADPLQIQKDECTYCGCRRGYDYLLYPKPVPVRSVNRKERNGGMNTCCARTKY